MIKYVFTDKAPKPVGPYSQAVVVGGWVFISGQIPINPLTGELVKTPFKEAVRTVLNNVLEIVKSAGGDVSNVVKVTVYMKDVGKFAEFNEVYSEFFKDHKPARAVVGVASLPRDADLMVEAIAYVGS
ncbi:MAG: deaminase [Zestosphaera tikiterensis]|uniref:Deaminase n=1 Tax=Zestosphaera tikiterensis TaxID=1973259 RepID=A0A2R7Y2L2_9CREN|nr:MAG: deaminase [Zestosphaera tikiterensis]